MVIVVLSVLPMVVEYLKHRREANEIVEAVVDPDLDDIDDVIDAEIVEDDVRDHASQQMGMIERKTDEARD